MAEERDMGDLLSGPDPNGACSAARCEFQRREALEVLADSYRREQELSDELPAAGKDSIAWLRTVAELRECRDYALARLAEWSA